MNTTDDLERHLRVMLADAAPRQEPELLAASVLTASRGVRQRPALLVRLGWSGVDAAPRTTLRLAPGLLIALLIAAVVGAIAVGSQLIRPEPPPTVRGFSPATPMLVPRVTHCAVVLGDGRVLIAGGADRSAEIYDPATGTSVALGPMIEARWSPTCLLLADGRVLIRSAGPNGPPPGTTYQHIEIFDPSTGAFAAGDPSLDEKVIVPLPDGRLLLITRPGLQGDDTTYLVHDPVAGTTDRLGWTVPHLLAALPLNDGRVFLYERTEVHSGHGTKASIVDPVTGSLVEFGDWTFDHAAPTAVLEDGRILLAGGPDLTQPGLTELFDTTTGRFEQIATPRELAAPRQFIDLRSHRLPDGRILIADQGDPATWVLFHPGTRTFSPLGPASTLRENVTETVLPTGLILITGGTANDAPLATVEIFDPGIAR